jgi:hypothetical protein
MEVEEDDWIPPVIEIEKRRNNLYCDKARGIGIFSRAPSTLDS